MKKDPLIMVLVGILAISALASAVLCVLHTMKIREIRQIKHQVDAITFRRQAVNMLASEAVEYSKRNPAINPILEAANLKPSQAGTKPAGN